MRVASILVTVCLALILGVSSAQAHKVIASAYASGANLEGEIGFSNGDMAKDVPVRVQDPSGRPLGETRTDGDGFFTFTPSEAVDHVFEADLGAGHVARFTVPAADLPKGLTATATEAVASPREPSTPAPAGGMEASVGGVSSAEIAALVSEAVKQEVRPLRREIAAYKEKHDMQSILGGIGYILGMAGLVFYMMARRRLAAVS